MIQLAAGSAIYSQMYLETDPSYQVFSKYFFLFVIVFVIVLSLSNDNEIILQIRYRYIWRAQSISALNNIAYYT